MIRGPWFAGAVLAVVLAGCAESSTTTVEGPPVTQAPSVTGTPVATSVPSPVIDYLTKGVWHRADGSTVPVPAHDYHSAVMWNDRLVATRSDGEVFALADVIAADGSVLESLRTTAAPVVNDAGATLAWVDPNGDVMTAWQDTRLKLGRVNLAAAGETVAWFPVAVVGGPDCNEAEDGCVVVLNSGVGKPRLIDTRGIQDGKLPDVVSFKHVSGKDVVTYVDKVTDDGSCSGLMDLLEADAEPEWTTCEYTVDRISPDGAHVIGVPAYLDGLGSGWVAVLDADSGTQTARYTAEDGFVADWAWSAGGRVVLSTYEAGSWQLVAMGSDGLSEDIGDAVEGEDADSPFTLIQH